MAKWIRDDRALYGVRANFKPVCPYCKTSLRWLQSKLLSFNPWDKSEDAVKDSHAVDTECVCRDCGWWCTFGVAISPEEHDKIQKRKLI